ncbi:MAG: hypothetical protein GY953_43045, partial [bacterium]|nr:hypothetical protein [bacterium]
MARLVPLGYLALMAACTQAPDRPAQARGEMAGEVTAGSVILQSRLDGPGWARFEISSELGFSGSFSTDRMEAVAERDFIVK